MPFYAVARGRVPAVYDSWSSCEKQVKGFPGAVHKKFNSLAEAQTFMRAKGGASSGSSVTEKGYGAIGFSIRPPVPETPPNIALSKAKAGASKNGSANGSGSGINKKKRKSLDGPSSAGAPSKKANSTHGIPGPPRPLSGKRVIKVWTDGASSNNGKRGAKAGWGVWFEHGQGKDVEGIQESKRLGGLLQTNNRAELMAIIRAIQMCPDPEAELLIYTDSKYAIQAITEWQHKWRRNGWTRMAKGSSTPQPVLNRDLIRRLEAEMKRRKVRPQLIHVRGHRGILGNEMADQLAVAGAQMPDVPRSEVKDLEPPPSDDESGRGTTSTSPQRGAMATTSDEGAQREAMRAWAAVEARKRLQQASSVAPASPSSSSKATDKGVQASSLRKERNVGTADVVDISHADDEESEPEVIVIDDDDGEEEEGGAKGGHRSVVDAEEEEQRLWEALAADDEALDMIDC